MIDSGVRLLSLLNQLDASAQRVRLDFEEGESGAMGCLSRMGFFDELSRNVEVLPAWPSVSGAEIHGGSNPRLVEVARIDRQSRDQSLPGRLTDALVLACGRRRDAKDLEGAAFTVFAELIDNVFSHSATPLDGYAALQVYQKGDSLQVAVSDSLSHRLVGWCGDHVRGLQAEGSPNDGLYEVVRDNLRAEPVARPDEERAAAPKATAARSTSRRCTGRSAMGRSRT
jgi:hypothetical protein